MTVSLCLGIDPDPLNDTTFEKCIALHCAVIDAVDVKILKPNLSFFLAHGSTGIAHLEKFCARYSNTHHIILDGKFGEISNSLKAYLAFAFRVAHSVTLNPFLGDETLRTAAEICSTRRGRTVFVLCATSQVSSGPLSFIQEGFEHTIESCRKVTEKYPASLGLVIGANRVREMKAAVDSAPRGDTSGLSILAPGLGAQKADNDVIELARTAANHVIFPMSRGIFQGGNQSVSECLAAYEIWRTRL